MEQILKEKLEKYDLSTINQKKNAIKEIIQEMILCGLSRGGFFNMAAFYGGTALRIFYGLDRFSEDLDFSLLSADDKFNLDKFFPYIQNELKILGFDFTIEEKIKQHDSNIKSVFLKGNTKELLIKVYGDSLKEFSMHKEGMLKIKFELDINPPTGACFEDKIGMFPYPYFVKLYDLPSLFAGKIHACLCRNWKTRIKGRDFYDFSFFICKGVSVNLDNLKSKLVESNFINSEYELTIDRLKELLIEKFQQIDIEQAKQDVIPFLKDKKKIDIWSKEYFIQLVKMLQ